MPFCTLGQVNRLLSRVAAGVHKPRKIFSICFVFLNEFVK